MALFRVADRFQADDGDVAADRHHDVGVINRLVVRVAGMEGDDLAVADLCE